MILPFLGVWPSIAPDAFVAPSADVIGDVVLGSGSSLWFGTVTRTAFLFAVALALPSAALTGEVKDPLLAEATGKHTYVFAEFVSKSCPVCRDMGPVAKAAVARHIGIVHQLHDADRELDLANKYQVRCVPVYVVVDPKGDVHFNDVGPRTAEEFDGIFKKAGVKRR